MSAPDNKLLYLVGSVPMHVGAVTDGFNSFIHSSAFQSLPGFYAVTPDDGSPRYSFVVLPRDFDGKGYGMEADAGNNSASLGRFNTFNAEYVRAHGGDSCFWSKINPSKGVWNWVQADQLFAANAGRKIIWNAWGRPAWQTDDAAFVADFVEYVRQVYQRYGSQIYAVEIWNEIRWRNGDRFSSIPADTNEQLAQIYTSMLRGARLVLPIAIKLCGPAWAGWQPSDPVRARMIDLGAASFLDIVSWHVDSRTDSPEAMRTQIQACKQSFPRAAIHINEVYFWGQSEIGNPSVNSTVGQTLPDGVTCAKAAAEYARVAFSEGAVLFPHNIAGESWTADQCWGLYGYDFKGSGPKRWVYEFLMAIYNATRPVVVIPPPAPATVLKSEYDALAVKYTALQQQSAAHVCPSLPVAPPRLTVTDTELKLKLPSLKSVDRTRVKSFMDGAGYTRAR